MGIFDYFWNTDQDHRISDLRRKLHELEMDQELDAPSQTKIKELTEENFRLRFRLGVLVRLLISKGLVTAEEYTEMFDRLAKRDGMNP